MGASFFLIMYSVQNCKTRPPKMSASFISRASKSRATNSAMADQLPIPQNGANSTDTPSGTTGDVQNPISKDGKKRLVKSDAVLEFIANTIQSKMTEFGLLLKEKTHGINKACSIFTDLINNSDHVIMQNKITTPDSIRGWIVEGKVLGIAEQANRKTAAAAGRGNNDSLCLLIFRLGAISWTAMMNTKRS